MTQKHLKISQLEEKIDSAVQQKEKKMQEQIDRYCTHYVDWSKLLGRRKRNCLSILAIIKTTSRSFRGRLWLLENFNASVTSCLTTTVSSKSK